MFYAVPGGLAIRGGVSCVAIYSAGATTETEPGVRARGQENGGKCLQLVVRTVHDRPTPNIPGFWR